MLTKSLLRNLKSRLTFVGLLFFSLVSFAFASDISITPASGSYTVGKSFTINVYVTNNTQAINAVSGTVSFPTDLLKVGSITKDGSIIKLWAEEPSFSNTSGTVKFEGVILNPGFSGSSGKVLSITFVPKSEGKADLSLISGSVLANDGQATNVTDNLNGASFTISPAEETVVTPPPVKKDTTTTVTTKVDASAPVITSPTYPNSDAWYPSKEASFAWAVPDGVTAVRTLYDEKAGTTPSKVYDPPINNRSFTVDKDGVYYIHIQFKTASGWGSVAHYKFQIDTTAPTSLKVTFPNGADSYNPAPDIRISADDSTSGIDHATIKVYSDVSSTDNLSSAKVDFTENITADKFNSYKLSPQSAGKKVLSVTVFDKAGNQVTTNTSFSITAITPPNIIDYTRSAEEGDVLKVIGSTYPNSLVEVAYINKDGTATYDTVKSDDQGNFTMLWTKKLDYGAYDLKVRVTNVSGAISDYSEAHSILIDYKTYFRFGMFVMNWLSLGLLLVFAGLAFALTLWFSFIQFRRFKNKISKIIMEVEDEVEDAANEIRKDIEKMKSSIEGVKKKRKLTRVEVNILRSLKKHVDQAEGIVDEDLEKLR